MTINGEEERSRNLKSFYEDNFVSNGVLLDEIKLVDLHITGGIVEANDLKKTISSCTSLKKLKADLETINEILDGTFENCVSLEEIIVKINVIIGYNALQNIPYLTKLDLDLVQTVRSDEFLGNSNFEEVLHPQVMTAPSNLFSGLTKLHIVQLDTASLLLHDCFKNCKFLTNLDLKNEKILNGDSHFDGCQKLETIDLSSLTAVDINTPNIFKGLSTNKRT